MGKNVNQLSITHIYSFLVHDSKGTDPQPKIGGTTVALSGNLFRMLLDMFERSAAECKIAIAFRPNADGTQKNPCRDAFVNLIMKPGIAVARRIAERLQTVTTRRSGLGLMFIVVGKCAKGKKLHVSRFPADVGILAEETAEELKVEFLEKVFMKNAYAYKAACYEGKAVDGDFWDGMAIDKQINSRIVALSGYWINDFLESDFKTTSAGGTRRLALAIKGALGATDKVELKEEITAMARLARNLNGQNISMGNLANRFGISDEARQLLRSQLENPSLQFERFSFSYSEFNKCLPYTSIDLSNGATLTAMTESFDECFKRRAVEGRDGEIEFKTQGRIVNKKFRKSK